MATFNYLPAGVSLDVLCCVLEQETLLCPQIRRGVGGGHIGFGVDPVGVGIHVALFP